jgi:Tfp pilus assembly protein PilZ
VSDVVTLARNARESLARGLNALQGDPNTPRQLLDLAAPIAQAMGALHQIERSGGTQLGPAVQSALANLQSALAQLQAQPPKHPAVATALESVAGALGSVHALARSAAPAQRPAPPVPSQAQQFAPTQVAPAPQPQRAAPAPAPQPQRAAPAPAPQPQRAAPARPPPQPAPAPAFVQPPAAQTPAAAARGAVPPADFATVTAELGAHSVSNFYKGLSGNDIIDHGGLFVSTYKLPKIGQQVRLRVSLPGGYEFEANAVVRWRREASDAGSDAPPGFGAQFTEITAEARQLVYRYVRNREPLFHDDF